VTSLWCRLPLLNRTECLSFFGRIQSRSLAHSVRGSCSGVREEGSGLAIIGIGELPDTAKSCSFALKAKPDLLVD